MASDEAQLRAIDNEFKAATTDDQRNNCAQRAAAVLARVEGDVFSSADEVRASLTKTLSRELVGTMTVATPELAGPLLPGFDPRHVARGRLRPEDTLDTLRKSRGVRRVGRG